MGNHVAILGAVNEEIEEIRKQMKVEDSFKKGKSAFWKGTWCGQSIMLVRTGVGQQKATLAFEELMKNCTPSLILSMGYAGSVDPQLEVGDLLIADKVLALTQQGNKDWARKQTIKEASLDFLSPESFKLAEETQFTVYRGSLLTVDEVIAEPSHKLNIARHYPVRAVEMETFELAQLARKADIPILSVRSILDTVDQELVRITSLQDQDGEVSKMKVTWFVLTHPASIKTFMELRSFSLKATRNLTNFLSKMLGSGLNVKNLHKKSS